MLAPSMNPDDDAKMFDLAPVSLWIEDYSSVRALFEQWRRVGVTDVRAFLATNPDRVRQCSQRIRVLKVNRKTLSLFGARDLDHLMANLDQVLRATTPSTVMSRNLQSSGTGAPASPAIRSIMR